MSAKCAIIYCSAIVGNVKQSQNRVNDASFASLFFIPLLFSGLEEFEEKIDKIAEGQDSGEENWISRIYNQFSVFNDVDNKLAETDLEGIEPPILDETWGLGLRNASSFKSKFIRINRINIL